MHASDTWLPDKLAEAAKADILAAITSGRLDVVIHTMGGYVRPLRFEDVLDYLPSVAGIPAATFDSPRRAERAVLTPMRATIDTWLAAIASPTTDDYTATITTQEDRHER